MWEVNRLNTCSFDFEAEEQSHTGIDLNEESEPGQLNETWLRQKLKLSV